MAIDQYDALGESYDVFSTLPYRDIESRTVEATLRPLMGDAPAVLELACGTGYYSSKLLEWGARSLTGLDLSKAMVNLTSKALAADVAASRARFHVGDASVNQPLSPSGAPAAFDVVFAAWLLNYAPDRASLTSMLRTVALNLKPGGVFVGVAPHPTDALAERAATYRDSLRGGGGPLAKLFPRNEYLEELASGDGRRLRVHIGGGFDIMTYHLKKSVYEEAAREAGMRGRLEWRSEMVVEGIDAARSGLSAAEWPVRVATPHCGLLVVWKGEAE